jgi:hypothetical protein
MPMLQQIRRMSEHSASLLLLLLLSADFVFIVLHIIIGIFNPNPSLCNISGICAHMHTYHLIKLFWVIILFAYVLKLTKCFRYTSWMLMFTFFLFDDALLLHQNIGDHISNSFSAYLNNLDFSSRFFELTVLAITGIILLAIVAWAYSHGPQIFRKISIDMLLFIAALVFFGLIVDLAETAKLGPVVIFGLGFIEDGGELVVDSLILWYVFLLVIRNGKPDLFLHDLVYRPR